MKIGSIIRITDISKSLGISPRYTQSIGRIIGEDSNDFRVKFVNQKLSEEWYINKVCWPDYVEVLFE